MAWQSGELPVDSRLAKTTASGQLICIVCNTEVKSAKVWTAHVNGRKHNQALSTLKQHVKKLESGRTTSNIGALGDAETRPQKGGQKRSHSNATDVPVESKRLCTSTIDQLKPALSVNDNLPSDFFDESRRKSQSVSGISTVASVDISKMETSQKTPWEAEKEARRKGMEPVVPLPNTAEALPEGFFDDSNRDRKIRNVPNSEQVMDEEFARFQKEIQREEQKRLESVVEEDESEAIVKEVETIDEQIAQWSRVNDLEKKSEDLLNNVNKERKRRECVVMDTEDDIDNNDIDDFDGVVDWRLKGF